MPTASSRGFCKSALEGLADRNEESFGPVGERYEGFRHEGDPWIGGLQDQAFVTRTHLASEDRLDAHHELTDWRVGADSRVVRIDPLGCCSCHRCLLRDAGSPMDGQHGAARGSV